MKHTDANELCYILRNMTALNENSVINFIYIYIYGDQSEQYVVRVDAREALTRSFSMKRRWSESMRRFKYRIRGERISVENHVPGGIAA